MPIRRVTVERRVVGTIDQAEELHCHYVVRADDQSPAFAADFTSAEVIAAAEGSPDEATFLGVIGAIKAHGRALGGTDGTHDEGAELVTTDGVTVLVSYRDVPPIGNPPQPIVFTLEDVQDDDGAPPELAFAAVLWAFAGYGDAASGFAS